MDRHIELKTQMQHQQVHNIDDEDGEANKLMLPNKWKRGPKMSSSCGSTSKTKGPIDCYCPQNPGYGAGKSGNPQNVAKEIERIVQWQLL